MALGSAKKVLEILIKFNFNAMFPAENIATNKTNTMSSHTGNIVQNKSYDQL